LSGIGEITWHVTIASVDLHFDSRS
jgi:hypothetical protein